MEVKLIGKVPGAEKIIAASSKSTQKKDPTHHLLNKVVNIEDIRKYDYDILYNFGHDAISEFSFYIFSISGVSRVLTHQLVRHRIASYLQMSSRHVSLENVDYVIPEKIKENKEALKIFNNTKQQINQAYKKIIQLNIPKEDARYLIGDGSQTNIVMGINARSLNNFFRLRLCKTAQWEIRELAEKMRDLVRKDAPILFLKAEKPCVATGMCSQKKPCEYFGNNEYNEERRTFLKNLKKYEKKKG
jgi:thymidylate synthase (FAD)